ncbi:hypothetical protein [Burkholderia gladioli]
MSPTNVRALDDRRDAIGVTATPDRLVIRWRDSNFEDSIHAVDVSPWLKYGTLAIPFAHAVFSSGSHKATPTRADVLASARRFLAYASSQQKFSIKTLRDISQAVVDDHVSVLESARKEDGSPCAATTKFAFLSLIRSLFKHLASVRFEGQSIPRGLYFPKRFDKKGRDSINHTPSLDEIATIAVIRACYADLTEIDARKASTEAEAKVYAETGKIEHIRFPDIQFHPNNQWSSRYITSRDLVPFFILLAIVTAYDPSTIAKWKIDRVNKNHPLYGDERWFLNPEKGRAGSIEQPRSYPAEIDTWANPVKLLTKLEQKCALLRLFAPPHLALSIFIRISQDGKVHSIYEPRNGALTSDFKKGLKEFQTKYKLPRFTMKMLRPTALELVHIISNGDIFAQKEASGQITESVDLIDSTYTSPAAKARDRARLARVLTYRERFHRSKGKIDPRSPIADAVDLLHAGATPGFDCFNIYDSPLSGQQPGRPCSGYGLCPACPLSCVNAASPKAIARVLQIRDAYITAKSKLDWNHWNEVYRPQLVAIEEQWLPLIPQAAIARAMKLELPPIPEMD